MGTSNNQAPIGVLVAVLLMVLLDGFGIPILLYLALGTLAIVYVWYAFLFLAISVGLLIFLFKDESDAATIKRVRKIGRIT